ncbi:MAG: hypothetical protein AAF799_36660 [Myxococcota bacterium]
MSVNLGAAALAWLVFGTAPAGSPGGEDPASVAGAKQPQDARFESVLLASEGLDAAGLDAELSLRLPDLALHRQWDLAQDADNLGHYVFVHMARDERGGVALELITDDAEAFVREIEGGDETERVAASFVVAILSSIEAQEVRADRSDVAAPVSAETEEVTRAVEVAKGEAEPEPEPEPAPEPEPEPAPVESAEPAAAPRKVVWELGTWVGGGVVVAMPPASFGSALAGGGGSMAMLARGPHGMLVGASLRVIGRIVDGHSLTRVRTTAHVGWAWRRGPVELPLAGYAGMEPWSLRDAGTAVSATDLGAQAALLNAGGWFAPGGLVQLDRSKMFSALRVGGRLDLGTAFVLDGGPRVAGIRDVDGNPLFRMGGFELGIGLDLCLYMGIER